MIFRILCFSLFIAGCNPSFSQSAREELRFAQYLIENNQYKDVVYTLKKHLSANPTLDPAIDDSMNYFIGWGYFNLRILDSASLYFKNVKNGPLYHKSAFYAGFDNAYLKKNETAKRSLEEIRIDNDSSLIKLRNFEFAGLALLERDYQRFEEYSKNFRYDYFPLAEEEKKSLRYCADLKKIKKKSPFVAGMMSAVVPGSGKIYAGYPGQGLAALMTVGILGLSAAESYYKLGPKDPQFITFGSLFTIFYVGNIWGSAISVKLSREHQLKDLDDEILFDMHIPLRRIFN